MNITHDAYTAKLPLWTKVRDVVAGEEVVKDKGPTYLPRLASHEEGDVYAQASYENYLMRADFYGAAGRTVQGLVGAIMSKSPAFEGVPDDDLTDIKDALGLNYESDDGIVMQQLQTAVSVGRYGLLVDKGDDPEAKPYVVKFEAEDIVFWATTKIAGRETLSKVIIRQTVHEKDHADPLGIKTKPVEQLLVLCLGDVPVQWSGVAGFEGFAGAGTEPVYWQEIWREREDDKKKKGWGEEPVEIKVPTKNGGRYWRELPFDIVNAVGGITPNVEDPPMLALANKILAHYRGSADLEWGRHMTAIPQPWVAGFQLEEGQKLVMGCGHAWAAQDSTAKAAYLEFSGSGLGHIADGQKDKKAEAAVLGARMLEEQPAGVEAMGTVKLRQAGDRSVLATIANNVSQAMTRALQRYLSWQYPRFEDLKSQSIISYELACDFDASRLDPAELAAMTQAMQDGSMSWETFVFNMRRGEMLPPGVTDEEERDRIQKGAPGRSRKDEAAMLQADVREGRISRMTYLESLQKLGFLDGVDIKKEDERAFEDKVYAAETQMEAFRQAGGGFAAGGGGGASGAVVSDSKPEGESVPAPAAKPDEAAMGRRG